MIKQRQEAGSERCSPVTGWREPEERYRTLFELAPDVIYRISAVNGAFTALSPTFETITGWRVEDWLGKPFADLIHPDDLPLALEKFEQGLRGEVPAPYELRIRSRSGEYLVGEFRSRPQIEEGRVVGKIGIARDITVRKRVEEKLRFLAQASETLASSLDYQTTLANVAHLAVPRIADWCVVDVIAEDGSIQRVATAHADPERERWAQEMERTYRPANQATASVLRSHQPVLISDVTDDVLVVAARDAEHLAILRSMGMHSAMAVPLVARDRILGAITLITTESGRHFGAADLSLAEDLARHAALAVDNALLYNQTQEALRLRDDFLSIASHELRTPLTSLHLQLQILERTVNRLGLESAAAERAGRAFEGTARQLRRLGKLSSDLLDVSRIAAGRLDLDREEMDLAALVREVGGRFQETLETGLPRLHIEAHHPVYGYWDRFRLDQVVTNLLSNAVKYGEGNPIDVTVQAEGCMAHVIVTDRGIGIALDDLARIFDRFERAARPVGGSLGLGLYICRQLVEAHGGRIHVTSRLGQGSTFQVDLPLAAEGARAGQTPGTRDQQTS